LPHRIKFGGTLANAILTGTTSV